METVPDPSERLTDPRIIASVVALIRGGPGGDRSAAELDGGPTTLYRIFDSEEQLLYVGVSGRRYLGRFYEHEDDKRESLEAELFAIQTEHPRFNFLGRGDELDP